MSENVRKCPVSAERLSDMCRPGIELAADRTWRSDIRANAAESRGVAVNLAKCHQTSHPRWIEATRLRVETDDVTFVTKW